MKDRARFIEELARVFSQEAEAMALLEDINFPAQHRPVWGAPGVTALRYWQQIIREVENGRLEAGGPEIVLAAALVQFPANAVFRVERDALPEALPPPQIVEPERQHQAAPPPAQPRPAAPHPPQPHAPPPQPRATTPRAAPEQQQTWPTLVFTGSERYDAFMRLVREIIGPETRLLYAAATETAVLIPRPGPEIEAVIADLRQRAEQIDPEADIDVRFHEYEFQPYLIQTLNLIGPDQQTFVAENIPATTPVRDIPHAVLGMYAPDARADRFGRNRLTVVDRIVPRADGGPPRVDRLNPDQTLHRAGVREGDQLQVQADSTAGAMDAQRRIDALARVRNEIHEYADNHPGFIIVEVNDDMFPTFYEIEFKAAGFGPPKEPAGENDLADPVPQDTHRMSLLLPHGFPLRPPFIMFQPPFFHPNVQPVDSPDLPKGSACLGPIRDAYRPDLDFHDLCQLLVDMASWRNYGALPHGVLDSHGFLDPVAARWALSEEGQERIVARGGTPLSAREQFDEPERPPLPLRIRHAGAPVVGESGDDR